MIDVTNPLEFLAKSQPPQIAVSFPDSAEALVQGWLPDSKAVKAFNIVNAHFMANSHFEEGAPTPFICGDDKAAKNTVAKIASGWGWQDVIDIGGIQEAYLPEALAMLWIRYGFANNYWKHAFRLMKK